MKTKFKDVTRNSGQKKRRKNKAPVPEKNRITSHFQPQKASGTKRKKLPEQVPESNSNKVQRTRPTPPSCIQQTGILCTATKTEQPAKPERYNLTDKTLIQKLKAKLNENGITFILSAKDKNNDLIYLAPVALLGNQLGVYARKQFQIKPRSMVHLGCYKGKRVNETSLKVVTSTQEPSQYSFNVSDEEAIDATETRNWTAFVNHSQKGLVSAIPQQNSDKKGAKKNIQYYIINDGSEELVIPKDSQLYIDYGDHFFKELGFRPLYCGAHDNWESFNDTFVNNKAAYSEYLYSIDSEITQSLGLDNNSLFLLPNLSLAIFNAEVAAIEKALKETSAAHLPIYAVDKEAEDKNILPVERQEKITPLMLACFLGNQKVIETLLSAPTVLKEIEEQSWHSGKTALFYLIHGQATPECKVAVFNQMVDKVSLTHIIWDKQKQREKTILHFAIQQDLKHIINNMKNKAFAWGKLISFFLIQGDTEVLSQLAEYCAIEAFELDKTNTELSHAFKLDLAHIEFENLVEIMLFLFRDENETGKMTPNLYHLLSDKLSSFLEEYADSIEALIGINKSRVQSLSCQLEIRVVYALALLSEYIEYFEEIQKTPQQYKAIQDLVIRLMTDCLPAFETSSELTRPCTKAIFTLLIKLQSLDEQADHFPFYLNLYHQGHTEKWIEENDHSLLDAWFSRMEGEVDQMSEGELNSFLTYYNQSITVQSQLPKEYQNRLSDIQSRYERYQQRQKLSEPTLPEECPDLRQLSIEGDESRLIDDEINKIRAEVEDPYRLFLSVLLLDHWHRQIDALLDKSQLNLTNQANMTRLLLKIMSLDGRVDRACWYISRLAWVNDSRENDTFVLNYCKQLINNSPDLDLRTFNQITTVVRNNGFDSIMDGLAELLNTFFLKQLSKIELPESTDSKTAFLDKKTNGSNKLSELQELPSSMQGALSEKVKAFKSACEAWQRNHIKPEQRAVGNRSFFGKNHSVTAQTTDAPETMTSTQRNPL